MPATDVVVVGGGATGTGVARDLAVRGLDVTLLERGGLLSGTSGRSHGLLHSGARYAVEDPESARACSQERVVLASIADACVEETGGLFVSLSGDDPAYCEAKRDACEDCGIQVAELSPAEAREREPGLAEDVARALAVPDAVVSPSRLVAATADDARRRGATIETDAEVADIRVADGRVTAVVAAGGTYEPAYVVNAAGAWAGEVAALAGVPLEMRPTAGAMVAVDRPVGPVVNRCREPSDGDVVVPRGDRAVLGTTSEPVDDPDDLGNPDDPDAVDGSDPTVDRLVESCAEMLPALADAPVVGTYRGVRPLYAGAGDGSGEEETGGGRSTSRGFRVLDHADDGVAGFCSVVGGKLTTHRLMAEVASDHVCAALEHDALCRTAVEPLAAADDPARLDELVAEFGGPGPADADVVQRR